MPVILEAGVCFNIYFTNRLAKMQDKRLNFSRVILKIMVRGLLSQKDVKSDFVTLLETIAAGEHCNSDLQLTCHGAQFDQVSMSAGTLLQAILASLDQRIYVLRWPVKLCHHWRAAPWGWGWTASSNCNLSQRAIPLLYLQWLVRHTEGKCREPHDLCFFTSFLGFGIFRFFFSQATSPAQFAM